MVAVVAVLETTNMVAPRVLTSAIQVGPVVVAPGPSMEFPAPLVQEVQQYSHLQYTAAWAIMEEQQHLQVLLVQVDMVAAQEEDTLAHRDIVLTGTEYHLLLPGPVFRQRHILAILLKVVKTVAVVRLLAPALPVTRIPVMVEMEGIPLMEELSAEAPELPSYGGLTNILSQVTSLVPTHILMKMVIEFINSSLVDQ
jgi:hypothetical protein